MPDNMEFLQNNYTPVTISLSNIQDQSCIFSFKENDTVYLKIHPDCKAIVSLECPQAYYLSEDNQWLALECPRNLLKLKPGIQYLISGGEKSLGYFSGKHEITVETEQKSIHAFFDVQCISGVSKAGQDSMIQRLESMISGISFDIFHFSEKEDKTSTDSDTFFSMFEKLRSEYERFRIKMEWFVIHMEQECRNDYVRSDNLSRQDAKSVRLSLMKPAKYGKRFVRKKNFSYDTPLNRRTKRTLLAFYRFLKLKEREIQDKKATFILIVNECDEEIKKANRNKKIKFSSADKILETNHIKSLDAKRNHYFQSIKYINGLLEWIEKYIDSVFFFLQKDEFKEVDAGNEYQSYLRVDALEKYLRDLMHQIQSKPKKNQASHIRLKSSLLFEYYGFYLLDMALKDKGYFLSSTNVNSFLDFTENQSVFYYQNQNEKVRVLYGKYCQNIQKAGKEETVSINSRHTSPDYLLEYYDINSGKLKKQVVLEVKYIPYRNIIGPLNEDITYTLFDYMQLGYLDKDNHLDLGKVDKVILIFPMIIPTELPEKWDRIYYLGINLEEELQGSNSFEKLKMLI